MTIGCLFAVNCAVGNNDVFVGPANTTSYFSSINLCNKNAFIVEVKLAAAPTNTPGAWIEHDIEIDPNDTAERTGFIIQSGWHLVVSSDSANVDAVGFGYQEPV